MVLGKEILEPNLTHETCVLRNQDFLATVEKARNYSYSVRQREPIAFRALFFICTLEPLNPGTLGPCISLAGTLGPWFFVPRTLEPIL
jgi:hypothetical protein